MILMPETYLNIGNIAFNQLYSRSLYCLVEVNEVHTYQVEILYTKTGECSITVPLSPSPQTGGRLNKKDGLTRYGNSHVKDKTS